MIPFFDYKQIFNNNKKNFEKIFNDVSSKGAFIMQEELQKFEKNLSKYHGIKYALGVGNATDAMELLLIANDVKRGSEIIFCSHTMTATASAIKFAGAEPVPVNCNEEYLLDYNDLKNKINSRTKGVFVTHLNGRIADMNEIKDICKKKNIEIYEDAAQALGAKYKGEFAGTMGLAGTISFYPAKTLGSFGDAGAILTNDKELYDKMRFARAYSHAVLSVQHRSNLTCNLDQ